MKKLLFYDISELGWARYLSAHLNYLYKKGYDISICTNKSRETLYRNRVNEILPIPDEFYNLFENYQSDGNCLYNTITNEILCDHKIISQPFKKKYPEYQVVENYSTFNGRRLFEPYIHLGESEEYCRNFRDCIVIYPRNRNSKFSRRNINKSDWVDIINMVCEKYPMYDIISIGGKSGTYDIDLDYSNYYNMVNYEDNIDLLVALSNMGKVITNVGTHSGMLLVSVICKANSFIIGEDRGRIFSENWTNANIYCWEVKETSNGYDIKVEDLKKQILKIIDLYILLKNSKNI